MDMMVSGREIVAQFGGRWMAYTAGHKRPSKGVCVMVKSLLLGAVGIVAVVGGIGAVLSAQTPASPAFEVASVKRDTAGPSLQTMTSRIPLTGDGYAPTGGLFHVTNYPLVQYIAFAYKMDAIQMLAFRTLVPDWVRTDRYDIEARATGNPTKDQMRLMTQALLADRSKLALHRETRQAPIFALVMMNPGQPGTRLRPYPDGTPCDSIAPNASARSDTLAGGFSVMCGGYATMRPSVPGQTHVGARNITLQAMANQFPAILFGSAIFEGAGRPVVDRTGLTGMYDFVLDFTPEVPAGANPSADPPGPTFREALRDQLGLKLESTTGPVGFSRAARASASQSADERWRLGPSASAFTRTSE
jgi:uncharacterized protein (TIGR03435 family)